MHELRIDEQRFRRDFDELAEIGSTGDGGVHRPSLSPSHLEARRWFRERIERDGLEFRTDGAANHSAVLSAARPDAPGRLPEHPSRDDQRRGADRKNKRGFPYGREYRAPAQRPVTL